MKHLITRYLSVAAILLTFTQVSFAQKSEIFAPRGKAINGYDPVAFFKEGRPVEGVDSLSFKWEGAMWSFANRTNLDAFKADPVHFAPQYGGYCAFGTAEGHKAPTQPETWTIVDDKLYFNYSKKVKEKWAKDRENYIRKADEQWPSVKTME